MFAIIILGTIDSWVHQYSFGESEVRNNEEGYKNHIYIFNSNLYYLLFTRYNLQNDIKKPPN